jgi:PmbA protein
MRKGTDLRYTTGISINDQKSASNQDNNQDDLFLNLDDGHKIISLAESLGAVAAEVFMVKGSETSFSIENNAVNFSASTSEFGIGIRVLKDKRLGFGYCTNIDSAEKAIKNALSTTKLSKKLNFDFTTKQEVPEIAFIFDKSILELTVEEGLAFTNQLIESSKAVDDQINVTNGGVGYGSGSIGLVNSSGLELAYSGTGVYAGVSTLLKGKTVSTGFEFEQSRINNINLGNIGTRAAELAKAGQNPKTISSGDYTVMFTPHAIAELLEFTVIPGLYGEPAIKGETAYSNKLGQEVTIPEISLIDDGTLENGINTSPVDDEGTPCQRTTLVENGVLKNYLFDTVSALEFDNISTGNAMRAENLGGGRSYKVIPKTRALNFTIEAKTKSYDDLLSELDNALVIHQLLGAHTANQASGDVSVNSPTLFKIEKGEVTHACKQVMISGNMPQFMKQILALGNDFKNMSGGLTPIASRLPSIAIENVKII